MTSFEKEAVNKILKLIQKDKKVVLGLATGNTPLPVYEKLIQKHKEGTDFSKVVVFHLDEYLGISPQDSRSYQYYLKNNFLDHVNIKKENCHFLNGEEKNVKKEITRYESLIKKEGGIDFQILGIGKNGHIGFNEPAVKINYDFLDNPDLEKIKNYNKFILKVAISQYKKVIKEIFEIKRQTREDLMKEFPEKKGREKLIQKIKNQRITFFLAKEQIKEEIELPSKKVKVKGFEELFNSSTHVEDLSLPTLKSKSEDYDDLGEIKVKAITLGIDTILKSEKIILLARGGAKAEIIKRALEEPISIDCPASLLRNHPNTSFILDEAAASLLSLEREKKTGWKIRSYLTKKYLSLSNKKRYLTVDLGGTYCRASLRGGKGELLFPSIKVETLTKEDEEVLLNQLTKIIRPLLKIGDPKKTKILIAAAGKIEEKKGIVKESRNLKLKDFALKKRLEQKLPFKVKEIEITNDIVAAWYGEEKIAKESNFLSFYSSTGIGGAFKDENLEPGWNIALSLDKENEVKTARFLEGKEGGFYKKSDLRKSEHFLEELAGGPALSSFAKENASTFPENKLAQVIQKNKIENIPEELSRRAKKEDPFARYCLKRTGKYAGIGIVTLFNHFFESGEEVSFNDETKFFINGSVGLNPYYFKGIKAGIKKGNKLFEHSLSLKNISYSKFKNSTEGVQKGLVFYCQNLIEKRKKSFPGTEESLILSDENLPPGINRWPLFKGKKIIVLEEKKDEANIFAGNLIKELKKENKVKKIDFSKKEEKDLDADLLLAPENTDVNFKGPVLFYKTFPSRKEDLEFNAYFEFNQRLLKYFLKAIRAYEKEIERVKYDKSGKFYSKYYGELLNFLSISKSNFAHPFKIKKIENGETREIKGVTSIKNIIEKKKGKNIFVSPHADDAEIAAGALIRWMIEKGEAVENWIVTESHNEDKRRKREAEKAKEALEDGNLKLEMDFMGFNKKELYKEEVQEKIKYQIAGIEDLSILFLPSPKDSHPTHQKVKELMEKIFLNNFDDFLIAYYSSPWTGDYNTYYVSDKNYGKGKKNKIASFFKKALGESGILGELCGKFKGEGFFKGYGECFRRETKE